MLRDRYFGSELSVVEYEFTFKRENTGFVRYGHIGIADKNVKAVILDPSPFLKSSKREYFLPHDGSSYPPEGQPVQFEVVREVDYMIKEGKGGRWAYVKVKLKIYDSWKQVDIREILRKKRHIYGLLEREPGLLTVDDVLYILQGPFRGDPTYVDLLTEGLAVFVHSSPPWWGSQGGILEGAIGKRRHFSALRYIIDLIPPEFRRKTSTHYYNLAKVSDETPPPSAIEANLCYPNPKKLVHLPLPLRQDLVTIRSKKEYVGRFEDVKPLIRARIIDSILINPIPENERDIMKATQEVIDLARDRGLPCPIEFGGIVPRISSGLARMNRKFELDKKTISKAVHLFEYLYEEGLKLQKDPLNIEAITRLDGNEFAVYLAMRDLGGDTRMISFRELQEATQLDPKILQTSIEKLRDRKVLYEPRIGHYLIVPLD